jgi:hypothetical protein
MNTLKWTAMFAAVIILLSFKLIEKKSFEFSYPKRDNTTIVLSAEGFKKFSKEWRGEDYYYFGESKDGMICSVLYYKLNKDEEKMLVEPFGGTIYPGIPFAYFTENSQLKKYETNKSVWGKMEDEFMFSQNDITEFQGIKLSQKHMYGFAIFDKDLFVNIHLSKENFTSADSVVMREILGSLTKVK